MVLNYIIILCLAILTMHINFYVQLILAFVFQILHVMQTIVSGSKSWYTIMAAFWCVPFQAIHVYNIWVVHTMFVAGRLFLYYGIV